VCIYPKGPQFNSYRHWKYSSSHNPISFPTHFHRTPSQVDAGKNYDEDNSYTGKIKFFDGKKGFGFIAPEDEDIEFDGKTIDDEKKNLYFTRDDLILDEEMNSNRIRDNTEVTFTVYTLEGKDGLSAGRIQLPQKNYEEETAYTGTVKFFDRRKGFGFITPDNSDIELNGETLQVRILIIHLIFTYFSRLAFCNRLL